MSKRAVGLARSRTEVTRTVIRAPEEEEEEATIKALTPTPGAEAKVAGMGRGMPVGTEERGGTVVSVATLAGGPMGMVAIGAVMVAEVIRTQRGGQREGITNDRTDETRHIDV